MLDGKRLSGLGRTKTLLPKDFLSQGAPPPVCVKDSRICVFKNSNFTVHTLILCILLYLAQYFTNTLLPPSPAIPMKLHSCNFRVLCTAYLGIILLFSISLLCFQPTTLAAAAPTNETDRFSLFKFKEMITNDPFNFFATWNGSTHFCNWQGVTCGRKHQRVTALDLHGNSLSGSISPYIGNLSFLMVFNLSDNFLHGEIPQQVVLLFRLQRLDLTNNSLIGEIPSNFTNCPQLRFMQLSNNKLTGNVPIELGSLLKLVRFQIPQNNLTGGIPPSLGNISTLEVLQLAFNNFVGNIPDEIGRLQRLVYLAVVDNNLFGTFPSSLYNISTLRFMQVGLNQLNGTLPANIGLTLPNLQILNIYKNEFSGPIPVSLSNVSRLEIVDLSYNNFMGQVPTDLGNLLNVRWIAVARNSLGELYQTTDGFSPSSLIGSGSFGSVYKGILDQEKMMVAVKVLNLQQKGASKSFMAECNALRNIRHRNLVKIVTCCSSVDYNGNEFKALVYEFMANGNLDKWLHLNRENESPPRYLNLLQRLNIAIDVAYALHYLHDHCETPIIHCDLKPSNILLDDDMIAKVSDFGLARILSTTNDVSQNQTSTVGIKGTIGYAAPEYGMGGEASTQGDVYSYGIFVLEMFTGKRPTDPMFKDGFNLHNFVTTALPEKLVQIVDPNLFKREVNELTVATEEDDYIDNNHNDIEAVEERIFIENLSQMNSNVQKCLLSVFKISLTCSLESPKERMNMGDVTKELHRIKNAFLKAGIHG
ncbi:putative receptor-like protein kinase At3g47110 [Corylus avellana]|uniref:putative receptor-like protein kinase At3g47110 n=1 Tax=Corylus avellana TaxID=13451 RepID=UPI00286D3ABB|nr:putative receptor-like protein kinase At3g47110 [Corylus avellana]